jgi:RNA recognition motif-containing protein
MNIYVSNLSFHTTDEHLKELFQAFGNVSSAKVIMDKITNRSRGFGFVEMQDEEAAKEAMKQLEGKEIEGKQLSIKEARPKEERSGSSFSGNRPFKKW